MPKYHQPLIPGETYHIFSRAIGSEKLFKSEENYRYFLHKYQHHLTPVAELFTYALLPNHFHLLVRIKPSVHIIPVYETMKKRPYDPQKTDLSDFVMERFSNWLNGYTKAFNKMYNRMGGLFIDYLRRNHAQTSVHFNNFLFYVHKNAVHHGLTRQIGEWRWDGFRSLVSEAPTHLLRDELMERFGGRDAFIAFHQRPIGLKSLEWADVA